MKHVGIFGSENITKNIVGKATLVLMKVNFFGEG